MWLQDRRRGRIAAAVPEPEPLTLLTDLVAYWDGDSDLDATLNLALVPEEFPAYGATGGPGGGPSCALGGNDSVYSEDDAFFEFAGMTLNAWVTQNETFGVETLSARTADQWTGISYSLFVALDMQACGMGHQYSPTEADWTSDWSYFPAFVNTGEWHMWTITMTASRMDLYLDGLWLCGLTKSFPTYRFPTAQFRVKGNHPFGWWSGAWANLGLWHRALAADEVEALYNEGSGRRYIEL